MPQNNIMQRLSRLERKVSDLQRRLRKPGDKKEKTWRDYVGMFRNDRDFAEAMALGAKYRRSTMPKRKKPKS